MDRSFWAGTRQTGQSPSQQTKPICFLFNSCTSLSVQGGTWVVTGCFREPSIYGVPHINALMSRSHGNTPTCSHLRAVPLATCRETDTRFLLGAGLLPWGRRTVKKQAYGELGTIIIIFHQVSLHHKGPSISHAVGRAQEFFPQWTRSPLRHGRGNGNPLKPSAV